MKFEYRLPLVSNDGWLPLMATNEYDASEEIAHLREFYDVQVRSSETKKLVNLPAPYGYNGGRRCDTPPGGGPCSCGAWH